MCHERPALSSRSNSVGTYDTGEGRYGPYPDRSGMQLGSGTYLAVTGSNHGESMRLSHPQPGPRPCVPALGFSPRKPSVVAEARMRCPPQDGVARNSKVRSEMAKESASVAMLGSSPG